MIHLLCLTQKHEQMSKRVQVIASSGMASKFNHPLIHYLFKLQMNASHPFQNESIKAMTWCVGVAEGDDSSVFLGRSCLTDCTLIMG